MEGSMVEVKTSEQLGHEWIEAIIRKDFNHLATLCQPDVSSSLLVPKRFITYDNVGDLTAKVTDWYGEYDSIDKEQARVAMVGQKLGIFYRLNCREIDASYTIEQQIYCTIRDGRIDQLKLVCSGFQPDQVLADVPSTTQAYKSAGFTTIANQPALQADALLEFDANGGQGSTCARLTPYIKQKLGNLTSGQVLEVRVDDVTAKEDIEAWSRLSGNSLLKMDQLAGQGLVFYILKK